MAAFFSHAIANAGEGGNSGESPMDAMRDMFGPSHVDQMIRSAVQSCWMALPKERRTAEEVEKQIRRLMERAISNLHEDIAAFGSEK